MAESQDATLLQRRARRRLVGAIALVVLIVIVLPIVLDTEPGPIGRDLVVQIPSQDAGTFNSRVMTPSRPGAEGEQPAPAKPETSTPGPASRDAATTAAETAPPAVPAEAGVSAPASAKKDAPSPAREPALVAKDDADAARAKALLEGKEAWVVRLGAFSKLENVRRLQERLRAAGVKSYTETAKGPKGDQTRVRAGPFDSKLEAEQAQEKLAAAGISPTGSVGQR